MPQRSRSSTAANVRRPRRRWLRLLAMFVLLAIGTSVLPVVALRWIPPPTSAFMLARHWEARTSGETGFAIDYRWVPAEAIAPELGIALVAAEDQKFPLHRGFDVEAIQDALQERRAGEGGRGASTISQQVAKNLFLWSGRSWLRKGLEAWYTILIEALWPKSRILEVYANIAEFGDGVYGAEAASQRYFGTRALHLNATQSARLAAVLPNPRRMRVQAPSAHVLRRQAWIQQQARQLGGPAYLQSRR